jgi:hypothetical protein
MQNMFKSKHFLIALIVTPILAIIAYFGVDIAVSEKPHSAEAGQSYKLISKSNCRYTSGLCDFENGEFKVQFRSEQLTDNQWALSMTSKYPLVGVKVSLSSDDNAVPVDMIAINDTQKAWQVSLPADNLAEKNLLVAIQADNTFYYGEAKTEFVTYETLFTETK